MNWGELWDFPFEADIWSSVWSGVGAIGTTSAVGITAYFYFRDQAEKNAAQARLVRFTMEGSGIASRYEITNNSDSSIYDVMLWWDLR
ncbi:hypothetical protein BCA37_17215 [Mycobacterium sp. djl-10]|nr:hypothetical protein BCA37_17215 [Mycobacterium sp. djl-10]